MNPEIKERWMAALRSGDYKQGQGSLRDETGDYCCLGVLCELAVADGVITATKQPGASWRFHEPNDEEKGAYGALPVAVQIWAGLDVCDPFLNDRNGETHTAATWNDTFRKSFNQIADMIGRSL